MTKCTFCESEIKIRDWFNKEQIERRKRIGICTNCWYTKLKPIEQYHISKRTKEILAIESISEDMENRDYEYIDPEKYMKD